MRPLTIAWQLVTECHYRCSYCYFKPYDSQINYSSISKLVLFQLNKIQTEFEIALLGGEPTLHPDFLIIIESLYKITNATKIDVISNFNNDINFWFNLKPFSQKLNLVFSLHFEYANIDFLKKIKILKDYFNIRVVFMVHPNGDYLEKMKFFNKSLRELSCENLIVNYLKIFNKDDGSILKNYSLNVLEFLSELELSSSVETEKIKVKYLDGKSDSLTQLTILNNELNSFQGWKCHMNESVITPDGFVLSPCLEGKKHIVSHNFQPKVITCPHKYCGCEGYWNYFKQK